MLNATEQGHLVFVVDDDPAICDALSIALHAEGYAVECFADATALLDRMRLRAPAIIVLDVMLPAQSGMDVLRTLKSEGHHAPVLLITGHGDIPMAVEAIKLGAYDFVEKPFSMDVLLDQLKAAITASTRLGGTPEAEIDLGNLVGKRLSQREREVLREIAAGASSREAGRILSISPRTVEVHRAHIMEKLGARNAADLMRIIFSHNS